MAKNEIRDLGTLRFGQTIDITDPCYNRQVWCRMNDVKIVPGDYKGVAYIADKGEWGPRVATLGIYLNGKIPNPKKMVRIGQIGVDAGMAGIFEDKPDFDQQGWDEFCNACDETGYPVLLSRDHNLFHGFCTSSGYGDGVYDVYAAQNPFDEITGLEIRFC